jgi:hypothetical protein
MTTCIAMHAHHQADLPIELLYESYDDRMTTINTIKAEEEPAWKIHLRKNLFIEIPPEKIPAWLADLWKQIEDLWKQQSKELIALHDYLCDCGWTKENNNIFVYAKESGVL